MSLSVKQPELLSSLQLNYVELRVDRSPTTRWSPLHRWLTPAAAAQPPDTQPPDTQSPSSCCINAEGIEIIKQFEGFPADVEPNVAEAEQVVRQLVAVPLTRNQFSALVSFTYQLGAPTLGQSALLNYLNAGRYRAAAKEFERWVYIGSRRFPKLVARRVAERKLFLTVGCLNTGY